MSRLDSRTLLFLVQVAKYFRRLAKTLENGTHVWVITHGDFLHLLMQALLNLLPSEHVRFHHNNVGVTLITLDSRGVARLKFLNRIIGDGVTPLPKRERSNYDVPLELSIDHPVINTTSKEIKEGMLQLKAQLRERLEPKAKL